MADNWNKLKNVASKAIGEKMKVRDAERCRRRQKSGFRVVVGVTFHLRENYNGYICLRNAKERAITSPSPHTRSTRRAFPAQKASAGWTTTSRTEVTSSGTRPAPRTPSRSRPSLGSRQSPRSRTWRVGGDTWRALTRPRGRTSGYIFGRSCLLVVLAPINSHL
jgi:hypothetical protein